VNEAAVPQVDGVGKADSRARVAFALTIAIRADPRGWATGTVDATRRASVFTVV
jgi:hypothetical protein